MNAYKPEIKLTLNTSGVIPGLFHNYYQEYMNVCNHGVQICARGLHRYVKLPKGTREITVRFYTRYVAESFEIGRRKVNVSKRVPLVTVEILAYCLLDHPSIPLLKSFRSELYRYYINGFKFFRIEY